jgi:hypothetical protein
VSVQTDMMDELVRRVQSFGCVAFWGVDDNVDSDPYSGYWDFLAICTVLPEYLPNTGDEVCVCDCDRCDNATALNCSSRGAAH